MNQQLKSQLGKLCKDSGIKWVNALPLVLHNLRACPRGNLNLSPYELLFGRPSPVYNTQFPPSELEVGESELTKYIIQLQKQLIVLHRYAAGSQNIPLDENIHPFQPGDWVLAKTYQKVPLQPTWEGPYQVLLTTPTSVKVAEKSAWLHHTRCKPASPPDSATDNAPYSTPPQPAGDDTDAEANQQTGPDRGTHRAQQPGPDRGTNRALQTGPDRGTNRALQTGPASTPTPTHWTSEIVTTTDNREQPPIRLQLRLQIEHQYLDFGIVDMVKRGTLDRLGDFDFCVPETRVLLRHSILPTLTTHQTWELFIRSPTYTPLGKLIVSRDGPWNRARCINGSYTLFSDGVPQQSLNWTILDNGGGESVYTDRNHPTDRLIHGFYCQRVDSVPRPTTLQGVCLRRTPSTPRARHLDKGELSISEPPTNHDLLSAWHSNTYVKLVSEIAKQTTTTDDCWICANDCAHLRSGIPFLGVPLTLQQHLSADVQSWNLTAVNLTHQYIYLTGPTKSDLCRKFSGNDRMIGESTCKYIIDITLTGSNHVDILKLTDILLTFMEESNAATQSILTELMEVRQMAIQNRLALDYILASTGGVCALVGTECCTYISDQTLNITGHLNNIHKLTDELRDIQHEGLSDAQFWSWLPGSGWIKQLLGNGL
ncbi:Hypothetical predicted protein [Podarcis lilfordi]|uniref:Murine leukemia virus integrase C-terminal domain-containing protein n=1 Tax=Podarcis lilfordi TaxID=74358 RepID=A0AA35PT20_9SAUR|nr:Hypothetical predicted protein [Podarcis lilfordi]